MLFTYTYVPHAMEKMQAFIDFIFFDVWCKAPAEEYGIHLFEPSIPLHTVMKELNRRDLAGQLKTGSGKWFYKAVNNIFNEFRALNADEVEEYRRCYQANNQIEDLCSNNNGVLPVRYADLRTSKIDLNKKIEDFFKNLYSSGFFGLSFVVDALGSDLGAYYSDFIRANSAGCCPFCGLLPIDNEFDPTREAFDHFLPKSKYPFNSVNPKNLAPSCNKCNSGNKRDKDPLHRIDGNKRKAFYPFSTDSVTPNIRIDVLSEDWTEPKIADITITISSASHSEEVETWDDLFRIKERYIAKCCDNGGGLYWRRRVLEESENYGLSTQAMCDAEIKTSSASPWAESNFLKRAYLESCQRAGLFDAIATEDAPQ